MNIEFISCLDFDLIKTLQECLLIIDDSCEEIYQDKNFAKIAVSGRHRGINCIFVKHNLYHQSKWSRTQRFYTKFFSFRQVVAVGVRKTISAENQFDDLSTMDALVFGHHGHGNPFTDYDNHFVMVFDLTSTQQESNDFIYPELTNAAISLELKFSAGLAVNTEVFLLGEKASTIYIDSHGKVSKNVMLNPTT